jgi:hypothetical protein
MNQYIYIYIYNTYSLMIKICPMNVTRYNHQQVHKEDY